MYNFYQSQIWIDIQTKVYKKPHFYVHLFGNLYFGIIKEKKIGPLILKRYQILGVYFPNDVSLIKKELNYLKQKLQKESGAIFLQLGIVNEIVRFENSKKIIPEFVEDIRVVRIGLHQYLKKNYQIEVSFRENMPQAGIVYDVNKSDEFLLKDMNESCRKRVKKAISKGLEFRIVKKDQYEIFFTKWQKTAYFKGFTTISKEQYDALLKYLEDGKGMLIGAFWAGELIAGTVCLFDREFVICPYGFYDRKFNMIGVQHFLKFKLFQWARDNGYYYVDTGGGAPTGFLKHPLASVTVFKQSLGGEKIEFYGNYDVILNKFLYFLFKILYKTKKFLYSIYHFSFL